MVSSFPCSFRPRYARGIEASPNLAHAVLREQAHLPPPARPRYMS